MKIQKIKINNNILKTYEPLGWGTILNLKPSKWEFNLKNIERELEFIEINLEYCMLIMDMSSTVHNCIIFQFNNYKNKNRLINKVYTYIHKTIYDYEGNQKNNFKNDCSKDWYEDYESRNELNSGVFLNIRIKKL